MEEDELKHKAVRSVIALTFRTIFLQLIAAVALFLLQIFLSPSQIGVFFVVTSLFQIFTLFTDVGLGAALVQRHEEIEDKDLRTVFFMQEILVVMAIALGVAVTPLIRAYSHLDAAGITLYYVLLFTLFVSSLKVIPSILMERKLAFEKQIMPQIFESIVYYIIVVYLAAKGFGVASYSWGFFVSALVGLPIYYLLSPWRVGFAFARDRAKHFLSFGVFYQGKSVLSVIKDNLFTVFLSGVVGTSGVGYWGTAQRWAYFPYRFMVDSVTKVTFPAYSRAQHNTDILRAGIERSLFAISVVLFPLYAVMTVNINSLIQLIPKYTKWEPAVISFYFLCAQALIAALTNILVNVLDATGRVKTTLYLMILWIIGTWGLTILLIGRLGFTGIAVAQFLVAITIVLVIYLVKRFVNFDFVGNVLWPLLATALMTAVMVAMAKTLPVSFVSVIATGAVGGIIYLVIIWLLASAKILATARLILRAYHR
ncbi:MAG: oligosaccharide flippase family protein [Patescibacteria group bacterium]|nr:oligosaccharide flippase family protein [Patescibacteria group bacterium]MCL5431550.1 oligosaccharide flippase family protein [Patescibacteria group bacterium]